MELSKAWTACLQEKENKMAGAPNCPYSLQIWLESNKIYK